MNEPVSEKDLLLIMLTELNKQLEEVDSIVETSFSELRSHWFREETEKLAACNRKVSMLENSSKKFISPSKERLTNYTADKKQASSFTFELGFH